MKSSIAEATQALVESADPDDLKRALPYAETEEDAQKMREAYALLKQAEAGTVQIWKRDWEEARKALEEPMSEARREWFYKTNGELQAYRAKPGNEKYMPRIYDDLSDARDAHIAVISSKLKKIVSDKDKQRVMADHPYMSEASYNELIKILQDFEALGPLLKATKKVVQSGRKPSEKPSAPQYVPPRASVEALKMVDDKIQEITKDLYDQMVKMYQRYYNAIVEQYFKMRPNSSTSPYEMSEYRRSTLGSTIMQLIAPDARGYKDPIEIKDRKAYDERVLRESKRDAAVVRDNYRSKMRTKLSSIVGEKVGNGVDLESIKIIHLQSEGTTYEGEVALLFADGSGFTVRNQAVMKMNYFGTSYVQYPTTFHGVKYSNGKTYKKRSEQQMNDEFVKSSKE